LYAFSMNFAAKLFSPHGSVWVAVPFALLVLAAVGVQFLQMARLNARQTTGGSGPGAAVQKYVPLFFAFIYIYVAAILNVYFIVSTLIRIVTQEVLFKRGLAGAGVQTNERAVAKPGDASGKKVPAKPTTTTKPTTTKPTTTKPTTTKPSGAKPSGAKPSGAKPSGAKPSGAKAAATKPSVVNTGEAKAAGGGSAGANKPHPRAKNKKARKSRDPGDTADG